MRRIIWTYILLLCIISIAGCHYDGHDDRSGNSVDGTRKKRTTPNVVNPNVTIIGFFPSCIEQQLNQSTNSSSTTRAWKGPVSYVIYHSRWYRKVNETCWAGNDTVECWIHNLVNVVRGQSRTLRAAQNCVVDYYEEYYGVEEYTVDEFPEGTTFEDSSSCETVDVDAYEQQLLPSLTNTNVDSDDVAFTPEYIDDVLDFAMEDLYCPECSCDNLAETGEYFETFEFEEDSCSACWYTTFATDITEDTEFWDEVSELSFQVGGFTQRHTCAIDYGMNFSDDGTKNSGADGGRFKYMKSCGLVQLGYRKADEVFVTEPNTPIADIYTISEPCISKIKKQTDNEVTTINFKKDKCDSEFSSNATHETYEFALRNRHPAIDPYATEVQIDRRVYIDFRFTCVYPVLNEPVALPMEIYALHRSIFLSLQTQDNPLEVTMSAFRDADFSMPFTVNDSTVTIPDPIWIKVTHNGPETAVVDIPSCWLDFPAEGSVEEVSVFIVLDGCPFKENNGTGDLDGAFHLNTCTSNVASFMFYSFYYNDDSLEIRCDVDLYEEVPQVCEQRICAGNVDSNTVMRRRSVSTKLELVVEPHVRECNGCSEFCKCDGVCGCDKIRKPKCFCPKGKVLAEDGCACV